MKFKLQLVIEDEEKHIQREDIIQIDKNQQPGYCLGLSLLESRELLKTLQKKIVLYQTDNYITSQKMCNHCHQKRRVKGHETYQYRTLFGAIVLPNRRLYNCDCDKAKGKTFSVLHQWLPEHVSSELQYIETKWASHISYQKTIELLQDILPIHASHNAVTVRNHLHKIAKQLDAELEGNPMCVSGCENVWATLPKPDKPLVVGSDGGYVRSCLDKKKNFEVIVGKVYSEIKPAKRFGFVQSVDPKPQRRLLKVLHQQGMQANQQISFLSDGADNVRDMQLSIMHPEAEHILDWFHITMRITVLKQFAKGFANTYPTEGPILLEHIEKIKWTLWHGKTTRALEHLEECYCLCFDEEGHCKNNNKKLLKHIEELTTYIENNHHIIPNYGDRWRYGEVIASSFAESTVNEVVTKRMVKKQQMQWSEKGAHYLLQARTATLNGDLSNYFESWYPGVVINQPAKKEMAALKKAA